MDPAAKRDQHRILIVDDEPPLLRMLSLYLQRLGYTVTTLGRTDQAMALVPQDIQNFDIAVLDATMQGVPLETIAAAMLHANRRLCVLAASGYPVDMKGLETAAPGRVAFLHKPFSPEMLASAVRRMIASQEEKGV